MVNPSSQQSKSHSLSRWKTVCPKKSQSSNRQHPTRLWKSQAKSSSSSQQILLNLFSILTLISWQRLMLIFDWTTRLEDKYLQFNRKNRMMLAMISMNKMKRKSKVKSTKKKVKRVSLSQTVVAIFKSKKKKSKPMKVSKLRSQGHQMAKSISKASKESLKTQH